MSDEAAVRAVMSGIEDTFSRCDAQAWAALFREPATIATPDAVMTFPTNADLAAMGERIFAPLRERNFARTELTSCEVELLTASLAVTHTTFDRYDTEGAVMEQLAPRYVLVKEGGAWLISILAPA